MTPSLRERVTGGLWGQIVGDALGVPAEFKGRELLDKSPVKAMEGYGTHMQPPGTWSDDSSMMLCTMESLVECGFDPPDMMARFSRWLSEGLWTARGSVFDVGVTCHRAIARYQKKEELESWGATEEKQNGNGSLMRLLPLPIFGLKWESQKLIERAFEVSALTHAHIRAKLCCAIYCLIVQKVLRGEAVEEALAFASETVSPFVPPQEKEVLRDLLSGEFLHRKREKISSSGYVLHCLEASLWCCHNYGSFEEAVLAAVNLGYDTDTTGAVTGGLAGMFYGSPAVLDEWVLALARCDDVATLIEAFADSVFGLEEV